MLPNFALKDQDGGADAPPAALASGLPLRFGRAARRPHLTLPSTCLPRVRPSHLAPVRRFNDHTPVFASFAGLMIVRAR